MPTRKVDELYFIEIPQIRKELNELKRDLAILREKLHHLDSTVYNYHHNPRNYGR